MIANPTDEADLQANQVEQKVEGFSSRALPSSSRQWSSFRNPRIVRVSRTFGGKDRHSKVCTVRGLRDRRIRLSVPTAIQLYDLQDKLGLSQPSKVIDWLLNATKQEIDKLPPLQMPQGFFSQFHPQMLGENSTGSRSLGDILLSHQPITSQLSISSFFPTDATTILSECGIKINDSIDGDSNEAAGASSSKYWDTDLGLRAKDKEVLQREPLDDEKGKSIDINEFQKQVGIAGQYAQLSAQSFFPVVGYSSFPSGSALTDSMSNTIYHSYQQLEPPNLSVAQHGGLQPQLENFLHSNMVSLPFPSPPSSFPPGSHAYLYPQAMPSLFPTFPPPPYLAASTESDPRQKNHFQLLSSCSSQPTLPTSVMPPTHRIDPLSTPFETKCNTEFLHPQDDGQSQDDEQSN